MIYLDNAATTGIKPDSVIKAVVKSLKYRSANPGRSGHEMSYRAAEEMFLARQKVAEMFNSSVESVCFTSGCTASLNIAIKGLKDGHIVCSSFEHNSVMRPLFLKNYSIFLNHPKEVVRPDTVAVVCTAASNVTGKRYDIKAIGDYCKSKGIIFIVDAAQGAGIFDIDCSNIDYLCIAPHKGFYAPMGVGVIIAKKPPVKPLIVGGTGSLSESSAPPGFLPDAIESGTQNLPGIMGIKAGIDFIKNKNIYEHELYLCEYLYNQLASINGVSIISVYPKKGLAAPIVSFNYKGFHSEEIASLFNQRGIAVRGGLHCAPMAHRTCGTIKSGAVRVSPSVFNDMTDMRIFIDTFSEIIKKK